MDLEKLKAEMDKRKLNADEFAMNSACGEYNCPCHYDLPEVIAEVERQREEIKWAAGRVNKLADESKDYMVKWRAAKRTADDLGAERDSLQGEMGRLKDHIKAQDEKIIHQRAELKEQVRIAGDAERVVATYREALGQWNGLSAIKSLQADRNERDSLREALKALDKKYNKLVGATAWQNKL